MNNMVAAACCCGEAPDCIGLPSCETGHTYYPCCMTPVILPGAYDPCTINYGPECDSYGEINPEPEYYYWNFAFEMPSRSGVLVTADYTGNTLPGSCVDDENTCGPVGFAGSAPTVFAGKIAVGICPFFVPPGETCPCQGGGGGGYEALCPTQGVGYFGACADPSNWERFNLSPPVRYLPATNEWCNLGGWQQLNGTQQFSSNAPGGIYRISNVELPRVTNTWQDGECVTEETVEVVCGVKACSTVDGGGCYYASCRKLQDWPYCICDVHGCSGPRCTDFDSWEAGGCPTLYKCGASAVGSPVQVGEYAGAAVYFYHTTPDCKCNSPCGYPGCRVSVRVELFYETGCPENWIKYVYHVNGEMPEDAENSCLNSFQVVPDELSGRYRGNSANNVQSKYDVATCRCNCETPGGVECQYYDLPALRLIQEDDGCGDGSCNYGCDNCGCDTHHCASAAGDCSSSWNTSLYACCSFFSISGS